MRNVLEGIFAISGIMLIILGMIFIVMGVVGILRFKDFYSKILMGSNVDTAGFIAVLLGIAFRSFSLVFFLKIVLIIAITLIINPIVTHEIANSAYLSGHAIREEERGNRDDEKDA